MGCNCNKKSQRKKHATVASIAKKNNTAQRTRQMINNARATAPGVNVSNYNKEVEKLKT